MEIQTVQDYADYIKCGEIFKSPLQSFPNSIILKCLQCADVHLLLESFVIHLQEHFEEVLNLSEIDTKEADCENVHGDEMESEGIGLNNVSIKLEEVEDPLFAIKNENKEEPKNEKCERKEKNIQRSENSVNDFEEYEDVYDDSPDEFLPDDTETDENYEEEQVIKKTRSKRKKTLKDEAKSIDSETDDGELMKDSPNKRKVKLSPFIDEFMNSKTNVLALIDFYKNQSDLWNKFSPYYMLRDKRKQLFQEITENLNNKCSLELTWNQVAQIMNYICGKHRDDFKRIQGYQKAATKKAKKINKKPRKCERKPDKVVKRSWFFDHLDFLRSKAIIHMEKLDSNLPDLTPEQIIQIIGIYQGLPHLWNTHLIENICSNKRHDALAEMLNVLETKMAITINTSVLEQYLRTMHNYFSKEKRQRLERTSTDSNCSDYYEHMSFLEEHEGPFNCPECNGLYTKPLCFRVHKATHDGSMPLICSQCKQEFKSVASYTTHAKRHLEDLQFICKECNMKFLRHSDLKIHLITHTDARPYCCEICGASYRQANSFRKHQRRHENRFSHTCHICFKGYYTKYRYVDHMNSHMNIRSYICKICEKGFITSRALKTHAVTHEEARNHACSLCGKTFKLKIGVLQHMRTHGSRVESDKKMI